MSTGTALEKFNPAALASIIGNDAIGQVNDPFAQGISAGEFLPMVSIRGNRFRLKIQGEETVLKEPTLDVFLVTSRPNVSKTFYEAGYESGGEAKAPDCSSADGAYPDSNVEHPQAAACQTCPNNAWGSKITPSGKKGKACNDYKLIVLALAAQPDTAFALRIPAASLKPFAAYISKLNLAGVPANAARTRITLGDTEYPSLEFDFAGTVETREDYETLKELAESSDVLNAVKIQSRVTAEAPVEHPAQQPVAVATPEPEPEPEPEKPAAQSLADLLGKPKTASKKSAPKAEPAPAPEPEPEQPAATENAEPITSLDQLLSKLKK